MQVTQIQQAVRNENRVNLFLDDEFWIGIDKGQLLEFSIFKGKEIDRDEKLAIEKASKNTLLKNRVLKFISIRPRSQKEIEDYLKRKGFEREDYSNTIENLKARNLISDLDFSIWFTKARLNSKKYGENYILNELISKGVQKSIAKEAMVSVINNDTKEEIEDNALILAKKFSNSIKSTDAYNRRNKIIQKLLRRGFTLEIAQKVTKML